MFSNFNKSLETTKEIFSCGICLCKLIEPRKCPICSFMAGKNCFDIIQQSSKFIFYLLLQAYVEKIKTLFYNEYNCPSCESLINNDQLINLNSLNELALVSNKNNN